MTSVRRSRAWLVAFVLTTALPVAGGAAVGPQAPEPSVELGARVYQERCTLCHGSRADGGGALPRTLAGYPETGLLGGDRSKQRDVVHRQVVWGGTRGELSPLMPPWGDELTWQEIESVIDYVVLLRTDAAAALALVGDGQERHEPSRVDGQELFASRCALCHGVAGEGNGKMARVIKAPPPFDLTASRLPDQYLHEIISKGGGGVGRSPQMPPWGQELSESQIGSVIIYLKTLRD